MSGRTEARITALLSLLAVTLLAHAFLLQPPPRAAAVFADRLLSALRFDGRQLVVELVSRRNMILLCHAILLLILKDAGLLAAPAGRRTSAAATAVGGEDSCSEAQPKPKRIGETRRSATAAPGASGVSSPTIGDDGHLQRERRRSPRPDKTTPRPRRGRPSPVARELGPADKQSPERCFSDDGVDTEIAAVEDKIAYLHSEPVADDERSRGMEEMALQETEPECAADVDEMNKKFEEFIASMRRNMQLESRQLIKV